MTRRNRAIWRVKPDAESDGVPVAAGAAVPTLVAALKSEPMQLNAASLQPIQDDVYQQDTKSVSSKDYTLTTGVVAAGAAISVADAMSLTGCSHQSIHKAIKYSRIHAEQVVTPDGPNAGRLEWRIHLDPAFFAAYPQAQTALDQQKAIEAAAQAIKRQEQEAELQRARTLATRQAALTTPGVLKVNRSAIAEARWWHLQRAARFADATGCGIKLARTLYGMALSKGEIDDMPDWVRTSVPICSDRTLERWEQRYRDAGLPGLEPTWRSGNKPELDKNPDMGTFAIGVMLKSQSLSYAQIHQALVAHFGAGVPSYTSVQRYLSDWKVANKEQWELAANPDKHRSSYLPAFGSLSEDVTGLNDLWEADATPVDLIFVGDRKRFALCCIVDVYSDRRIFSLVEHAGAKDQVALLRDAILRWGKPRRLKTDNGKDYKATHVEQALARLEIEHIPCPPFRGDRKPHVERGFRTFLHDLIPGLPGFCGHNVAQAQDIRAQKSFAERLFKKSKDSADALDVGVTRDEFEAFMNLWLEADELRERGRDSHIAGKTPRQVVDEWSSDPLNHVIRVDPAVLDYLLRPSFSAIVQKKGIKYQGHWYVAPSVPVRSHVEVRETDDVGRLLVFQGETYLTLAECPDITGISRKDIAIEGQIHYNSRRKALREANKALKQGIDMKDVIASMLHHELKGSDNIERLQHADVLQTESVVQAMRAKEADLLAQARQQKPLLEKRELSLSPDEIARIHEVVTRKPEEDAVDRYVRLRRLPMVCAEDRDWMDRFELTPRGIGVLKLMPYPHQQAQ